MINIVSDIKYVKETEIHLSDTALKSALLKSYERGVSDNKKRKRLPYSDFWSVSLTLLLSNLTADFERYPWAEKINLSLIMWIIMGVFFAASIFFTINALLCNTRENANENSLRDKAVEEIFSSINLSDS